MNKRALLLTAATAALLSGPAFADTHISTATTTALKTSTVNSGAADNIVIDAAGSVTITANTPVITIDSSNTVTNNGTLSNKDTNAAVGVKVDLAAGSLTGNFDNVGIIDLTGTGVSKIGVLVSGAHTFNGNLDFEVGSQVNVTGDSGFGVFISEESILNGDLTLDGSINVGSSTTTTPASNVTAVRVNGDITGDVSIAGALTAIGNNAQGFLMTGDLTGSFTLGGSIVVRGTNAATTAADPEAGVGLLFAGDVTEGVVLAGKTSAADSTARSVVEARGSAQTIFISPQGGGVTPVSSLIIGLATADSLNSNMSFINRGTVTASPIDFNLNAIAVQAAGFSDTITATFTGGFFNSGTISSVAATDISGTSGVLSAALWFSSFSQVPTIVNDGAQSGAGVISATIAGEKGGSAYGIRLDSTANHCPSACTMTSIVNSGIISASASTSDTTNTALDAFAILDLSGSVNVINNSGTISATATDLDGHTQQAYAAQLGTNTSGIMFTNTGGSVVIGDVLFGSGSDTFFIGGSSSSNRGFMSGNIDFNGGANDKLTVDSWGTVIGAVTEQLGSSLDVLVNAQGTLRLTNDSTSGPANNFNVYVDDFTVKTGGTLGIALSEPFNNTALPFIDANTATLETSTLLDLTFGSFLTVTGSSAKFVLIDTPAGMLNVDLPQLQTQVCTDVPFFFVNDASCLTHDVVNTHEQLVLTLTPKDKTTLGLEPGTFAFDIYENVNLALATDDELGSGVINGIGNADDARAVYAAFAPDVTGSSRAIAISLTDQATGPVATRQRALRMYAAQQGSATMWGQEFAQRLNATGNDAGGQYRNTGFGFVLGLDGGDPNNGRYGGAFTFYTGDTSEQAPRDTKTSSEWYMLTGYTDWRGKGLFFDSQLSVGYGTLNGRRYLDVGNVARVAESSRTGLLFAGGFTTGVVFAGGGTVFTPQFSVDGMTMREDGYEETGGGTGFDLKVEPYYGKSLRAYVGTSLRQDLNFGDFYLQPEARVGYRYDFLSDPAKIKASFPSVVPISQFTLIGPDPGKGNFVAGGSLAATTGAWSIGLNYDLATSSGNVSHTGTIMLTGRI